MKAGIIALVLFVLGDIIIISYIIRKRKKRDKVDKKD